MAKTTKPARRIDLDQEPIWEIQFDETVTQYRAFCLYRDLMDGRSIAKVTARWGKADDEETGKLDPKARSSRLEQWSVTNRWVERADAYILYVERKLRDERETDIGRMQRMEGTLGRAMVSLAMTRIVGDPNAQVEALDVKQLTAGEVAMLARAGVDISRISTNRPTQLIKAGLMITSTEFVQATGDLTEILMGFIKDELKPLAAEAVRAYASGERRMIGR